MHRVLIDLAAIAGRQVILRDRDSVHHLVRVLRVAPGEAIECLDGHGLRLRGRIETATRTDVTVAIEQRLDEPPETRRLVLGLSLIRPERFEWALEKASELGVDRIVPLAADRSRRPGPAEARMLRWRRILDEAMVQCGRAWRPVLEAPVTVEAFVQAQPGPAAMLTLEEPSQPFGEWLRAHAAAPEQAILIGPEGDFTAEEVRLARASGVSAVRMAGQAVRAETAAIVAVALCRHAAGRL